MINGFEYRDNLPKCPERSDRWLSPSNDECERDDECEEDGEDGEGDDEPSEDSRATKSYSIKNFQMHLAKNKRACYESMGRM